MARINPQLERKKRRRLGVDPSVLALPDTTDLDIQDVTQRAQKGLRAKRSAADIDIRTRSLEERIRSGKEGERLTLERIDIRKSQNEAAEKIDLAGLGLSGLSGLNLLQEADRQLEAIAKQIAAGEAAGDIMAVHNAKMMALLKGFSEKEIAEVLRQIGEGA